MTYSLAIGDRTHSSWSLRGWLLFSHFDIPVNVRLVRMYTDSFQETLKSFSPARTVPAVKVDGVPQAVWDTLAIAETLHERHPDAGIWPSDAGARQLARTLVAEMHSSFGAIRSACAMNLAQSYAGFPVSDAVAADLARIEELWSLALDLSGGPWLFGAYSAADAFFAPVAARIAGYGLPVSPAAKAYVEAHLNDTQFRQWRAMGKAENYHQSVYDLDYPHAPWPGPAPLPAEPVTGETPINTTCPYSDDPVRDDSLARIDGKVVGFCNPFCRDKSVADAGAWPALVALLES